MVKPDEAAAPRRAVESENTHFYNGSKIIFLLVQKH